MVVLRDALYKTLIISSFLPNRKKKKKLNHQVSIYNPNGTSFLPGHNGFPETREDNDDHEYASIEDTLVYTHLLRKGREIGVYGEFDTYRPFTGHTESHKPLVSEDTGADNMQDSKQQLQVSSQKPPPLPIRPLSHDQGLVDNVIYQAEGQSEEERSPSLGPRLEPEGGNWGEDWIWFSAFHLTYLNSEIFIPWHLCDCLMFSLCKKPLLFSSSTVLHQSQAHKITLFKRLACFISDLVLTAVHNHLLDYHIFANIKRYVAFRQWIFFIWDILYTLWMFIQKWMCAV